MGRGGGGGLWGGDFGSGSGSKFNCAARVGSGRVGSGQTISGTGRVRASVLSPCRPLINSNIVIKKFRVSMILFYLFIKENNTFIQKECIQ